MGTNKNCDNSSYSPLPSRRRTQKLENVPMANKKMLLNTQNCKKSKSLLLLQSTLKTGEHTETDSNSVSSSYSSSSPPIFTQRKKSKVISLQTQNNDKNDNDEELQLQRDVSREDVMSGDEVSDHQFPTFEERARRKTVESNT